MYMSIIPMNRLTLKLKIEKNGKNDQKWKNCSKENDLVASGANIFSNFKIPCINECLLYTVEYPKVSGEAPKNLLTKCHLKMIFFLL